MSPTATDRATRRRVDRLEELTGLGPGPAQGDRRFWVAVAAIVAVGSLVVFIAYQGRQYDHPTTMDSWTNQLDIYDCTDQVWIDPPTDTVMPTGLRLRDGGRLTIEPLDEGEAGAKATLGRVFEAVGGSLDDTALDLGSGRVLTETGATCDGEDVVLQLHRWRAGSSSPTVYTSGLADIRLDADGDTMVVALAPLDTEIVPPASES